MTASNHSLITCAFLFVDIVDRQYNECSDVLGQISDIEIRLLRVFLAIVKAGGFAPACAVLNIGESTISSHMADLEARLGMRLCDRGRSGFRLTKAGARVYEEANNLMSKIETFRSRMVSLKGDLSGTLRLLISDGLLHHQDFRISTAIDRFYASDPDVHLSLVVLTPRDAEQAILNEDVDIAISPKHQRVPGINYISIFFENNYLYCGRTHPLYSVKDAQSENALVAESRIISRGYIPNFDRGILENAKYGATVYEIEAAQVLIESGQFLGFLPEHKAKPSVAAGLLKPIQPDRYMLQTEHAILTKMDRSLDNVARAFLDVLVEAYEQN